MDETNFRQIAADVKCYHCGHISGQIIATRNAPIKVSNFVPREGYSGPELKPGMRLRCERCQGPVFLEDATPLVMAQRALARSLRPRRAKDEPKAA